MLSRTSEFLHCFHNCEVLANGFFLSALWETAACGLALEMVNLKLPPREKEMKKQRASVSASRTVIDLIFTTTGFIFRAAPIPDGAVSC